MTLAGKITAIATVALLTAAVAGCTDVDDERIPMMNVRVQFTTVGDWNLYGIAGAMDTRRFIRMATGPSQPAGFPYTGLSATGFGGLLVTGTFDYSGDPRMTPPAVFDLACPVEQRPDTRVRPEPDNECARCPVCGSTYDIYNGTGMPLSGPAARDRYGLRRYHAAAGSMGEYLVITN